jgi:hypothetical protein
VLGTPEPGRNYGVGLSQRGVMGVTHDGDLYTEEKRKVPRPRSAGAFTSLGMTKK